MPDSVTPEVRRNLERMGFGLRYVPTLDLGSKSYLRERRVKGYLTELQRKYPEWKVFESLSDWEKRDYSVPKNLRRPYWERVRDGDIDFPVLPGQWLAVETVEKPAYGRKYARTPFAEKLGFGDDRFNVPWYDIHDTFQREKRVLSDIGLPIGSTDLRLLEALEWNLLGNREGWGKTNTSEWTNTENTEYSHVGSPARLIIGHSGGGGAAFMGQRYPGNSVEDVGFRAALVLGS